MKRRIAMLVCLLLVGTLASCMGGCGAKQGVIEFDSECGEVCETHTDFEGVNIQITDAIWNDTEIKLVVNWMNETSYEVTYGDYFIIEREKNDTWVSCKKNSYLAFHDIGYELRAGSTQEKTYYLAGSFRISKNGKYRIRTECSVYDKGPGGAGKKCELWAEFTVNFDENTKKPDLIEDAKPVIYLYPEEKTEVSVNLTLDGRLTCTYPAYNEGWTVTAAPDGTLTDAKGQIYNYLYWEGESYAQYDLSKGFCVKGEDTAAFLEDSLARLGLTRREANEFIVYWLPLMEANAYNIISFQTDIYTDAAKLEVSPAPDTLIRVFMAWQAADSYVELPEQELTAPERTGFTVVEWGGAKVQ